MQGPRIYVATTLVTMVLAQAWVIANVFRHVSIFERLWADFGGRLPAISRFVLEYHASSLLVLLVSAGLTADVLRRRIPSYGYAAAVFGFVALDSFTVPRT